MRRLFVLLLLGLSRFAGASDWPDLPPDSVVLMRHALAPGGGDPAEFKLDDCNTQRNLSQEGREQAQRIGRAFAERGVKVGAVWSSQWCRTRETADLAFPGQRQDQPTFNSFFGSPASEEAQTRAALAQLQTWRGPGVLVVITHQVNITALTGVVPESGSGVVLQPQVGGLKLIGRLP
ncbi:histidine phosphatase family protein [Ideonella margarita]|uniref:Histidine phosphatase family protein n=1 Tax=Ideonella margarita TaxID=2984191 RepID=A0ABU9C3B9_9BURK